MKYITVSLVSVLGSSVGSVSSYSSGPKIDPRVQNIFCANGSLSADSRRACCQLLAVKIRVSAFADLQRNIVVQKLTVPTYEYYIVILRWPVGSRMLHQNTTVIRRVTTVRMERGVRLTVCQGDVS